jgi:hypothetical protein
MRTAATFDSVNVNQCQAVEGAACDTYMANKKESALDNQMELASFRANALRVHGFLFIISESDHREVHVHPPTLSLRRGRYTAMGDLRPPDSCSPALEGYGKAKHIRRVSAELYLPLHYIGHGINMTEPIDSAL